jgi:hypothetical protein
VAVQSSSLHLERTLTQAERFLDELRRDIERAALAGLGSPPRLRSVHERPGHASPEFRTLVIPTLPGQGSFSPDFLSAAIACFAAKHPPDRLVLALDAMHQDDSGENRNVLIAEARDVAGTRLFWRQCYAVDGRSICWEDPSDGGWIDPGEEEMILDAAFSSLAARRSGKNP